MYINNNIDNKKNESAPSGREKPGLLVIKIGGNIVDEEKKLASFLTAFASINSAKILVHGGGKLATKLAAELGIPQQIIEGRRITDAETLKLVTMVYAGYINKNIVAKLQAEGCNAIGLCGADANLIQAHRRQKGNIDYGFAGDIDIVNTPLIQSLVSQHLNIVVAPLTHNRKGLLLNTNADTVAQEIAQAMSRIYTVQLIYCFEKKGVLKDVEDESSVIPVITSAAYKTLKEANTIFAGMLPKLDNAFAALQKGVHKVVIGKAENILQLCANESGTSIIHE